MVTYDTNLVTRIDRYRKLLSIKIRDQITINIAQKQNQNQQFIFLILQTLNTEISSYKTFTILCDSFLHSHLGERLLLFDAFSTTHA